MSTSAPERTSVAAAATTAAPAFSAPMPFWLWVFVRITIPTGPVLIQLALWAADLYVPTLVQPTFVVLVFGLALATSTEYKELKTILWVSVLPALAASVFYTAYLLTQHTPARHERALILGFYLWLSLVAINLLRVLFDVAKRTWGKPA